MYYKMTKETLKTMDMRPYASFVGKYGEQIQIVYTFGEKMVFSPANWIYVSYGGRRTAMQVIKIMIHPRDGLWFECKCKNGLTCEVCIEDIIGPV